jgi:hypothetical protein
VGEGVRAGFALTRSTLAALCLSAAAFASEKSSLTQGGALPKSSLADAAVDERSITAAGLFSKPLVFRGTLGDMPIQATVRPKEIVDEGLEGEYFIFGRSQKILLAGELDGDSIFLEESENGTNISGQWEGKLVGDSIKGTWLSADESISKPFSLKLVVVQAALPKPGRAQKPTATANPVSAKKR